MLRISISGSHCSGKTTLLNLLKDRKELSDFLFLDGPTRKLKEKGMPINNSESDNYDSTQLAATDYHLENLKINDVKSIISDRCMLDCYIYTKYLYNQGKVGEKVYNLIRDIWVEHRTKYDLILIQSIDGIPLVKDKHRIEDKEFRETINTMFSIELNRLPASISFHYVDGSVEKRVETILKLIKLEQKTRKKDI